MGDFSVYSAQKREKKIGTIADLTICVMNSLENSSKQFIISSRKRTSSTEETEFKCEPFS